VAAPSLQDGIDKAGSPMNLLWTQNPAPWNPEVIKPEYAGWRQEQAAWHETASISDLSHHMFDTVIEGPDATKLLMAVSANNYEKFAVGQAKQFVPVTSTGQIVTDGILLRLAEQKYMLTGIPAAQNWVKYHGEKGGYDVKFATDPSSAFRGGGDPGVFRYQVQGPAARELVETVFGGPLPAAKFFHSIPVALNGMDFTALRHNMSGQDGYEFIGPWEHAAAVKDALLSVGDKFGLVHVGALAYASASVESGWIPSPVPAIYTAPDLADYRGWLPLFGIEGKRPLNGSSSPPTSRTTTSPRMTLATASRSHSATTSSAVTRSRRPANPTSAPRSRSCLTPRTCARCSARTWATTSPTRGTGSKPHRPSSA
jgi:vanillate/3-O-methylgallate O-demethylase